jgi:hypothetical protein
MDHEERDAHMDARLSRALRPPEVSAGFRSRLRARIDQDSRPLWHGLPDVLHLGGCAVAILTCAALIPYDRSATLGAGVIASLASYIVLTAVRGALEDA